MAILKILTAPDPLLKKIAEPVEQVDDSIRILLNNMLETMYDADGVGLAATQVGVLKQIIVIDIGQVDNEQPSNFYPLYMINPKITNISEMTVEQTEGCLSIPEQGINIKRSITLTVEYIDYYGNAQILHATNFLARAIQHEMDHLSGILLIDYLTPIKKDVALRKLVKVKRLNS